MNWRRTVDDRELLVKGAEMLGVSLDDSAIERFFMYRDMLIDANSRFNLTAIEDGREIVIRHFLDSLSLFTTGLLESGVRVADIGTGAGFPGIPIKIADPSIELLLVDSTEKKVAFVASVCGELGLSDVRSVKGRAEELALDGGYRERYDVAVSRGVASLSILAELCIPFVTPGGHFVAMKGPKGAEEAGGASNAFEELGGNPPRIVALTVPFVDMTRSAVISRKISHTPSKYPRKYSQIAKKPL